MVDNIRQFDPRRKSRNTRLDRRSFYEAYAAGGESIAAPAMSVPRS